MKRFRHHIIILLYLPLHLFGQSIQWANDYTGSTQSQVPAGWTISTQQDGQISTWQAQESPGASGSPGLLVLAMTDPGMDLELVTTTLLQEVAQNLQVTNRINNPAVTHLLIDAEISGISAKLATIALQDQGWLYVGIFAAPDNRFQELGGAELLYQALRQDNPYSATSSISSYQGGALNMQDTNIQNQILQQGVNVPASALVGSWLQSFSMLTGDDYLTNDNSIRTEERGYAHMLELRKDNSYRLTFRYQSYSAGCPYEAQAVESGRYEVSANTLTLARGSYKVDYNICGNKSVEHNSQLEQKSFQIGSTGNELVLRGTPFEYNVSTETDTSGKPFFQEGFRRQ